MEKYVTYFELLQMVAEGDPPKKVKFNDLIYEGHFGNTAFLADLENISNSDLYANPYEKAMQLMFDTPVKAMLFTGYSTLVENDVVDGKKWALKNHFLSQDVARKFSNETSIVFNQEIEIIE